jgi:hypothetical protein
LSLDVKNEDDSYVFLSKALLYHLYPEG